MTIKGRTGRIIMNGKVSGFIGEVHPAVLKNLRMKTSVSIFEIRMKELYK